MLKKILHKNYYRLRSLLDVIYIFILRLWKNKTTKILKDLSSTNGPVIVLYSEVSVYSDGLNCVQTDAIEHYKSLGFKYFVLINFDVYYDASLNKYLNIKQYTLTRFDLDELNILISCIPKNIWVYITHYSERLVFPHFESRNVNDLTDYLNATNRLTYGGILVHLYNKDGKKYFDTFNYYKKVNYLQANTLEIYGGVMYRTEDTIKNPYDSVHLNRVIAVKASKRIKFKVFREVLSEYYFNEHYGHNNTSGVLLNNTESNSDFFSKIYSKEYSGSQSLTESKLLNRGSW